ncbi:MAG: peptidylprolyl isomerase [Lachnotalea sp.]
MKKNKIKIAFIVVACILVAGIGIGCSEKSASVIFVEKLSDNDVFRINGSVCTLPVAKIYLTNLQNQYESVYDSNMWDKVCGDITIEEYVKKTVITELAQIKSMSLFAKEYNIELTEEEKNIINKASKEYYDGLNDQEISDMGITQDDVSNAYSEYLLASKVYSSLTNETNTEVSDDEARVVTIQQIVINKYHMDDAGNKVEDTDEEKQEAYTKAQTVLERAQNDEDFATLADNYSDNEICELSIGRDKIEKNVEKIVFNMENDELSGIIEIEDGYYIIKCINSYDMEATDANKEVIIEQRKTKAFDEAYEVFVSGLVSEFNDQLWANVTFEYDEKVKTANFFDIYNQHFE